MISNHKKVFYYRKDDFFIEIPEAPFYGKSGHKIDHFPELYSIVFFRKGNLFCILEQLKYANKQSRYLSCIHYYSTDKLFIII